MKKLSRYLPKSASFSPARTDLAVKLLTLLHETIQNFGDQLVTF
jgi:hypothetical protein